jgi:hypothetical protein
MLIHLRQANRSDSDQVEEDKQNVCLLPFNFNPTRLSLLERVHTRSSRWMIGIGAIPPEAEPRFFFFKPSDLIYASFLELCLTYLQPLVNLQCFTIWRIFQ